MNRLPIAKRAKILNCLVEGNSLRAASRLADVSINTVYKLLVDAGEACLAYQDQAFRNLTCKRLQLDEIWSFIYTKQRNVMLAKAAPEAAGDVWTWVAICADTKLVPSWRIGDRSGATAIEFVCDLSNRLASRVQVTSDGPSRLPGSNRDGLRRGCRLRPADQNVRRSTAPGRPIQSGADTGDKDVLLHRQF
jgi:hypothetical protein